jgi:hypothetical protein
MCLSIYILIIHPKKKEYKNTKGDNKCLKWEIRF